MEGYFLKKMKNPKKHGSGKGVFEQRLLVSFRFCAISQITT